MERKNLKIFEIDRWNKSETLKRCKECGSRILEYMVREHLAVFHPAITTIVQRIAEKVQSFPDLTQTRYKLKFFDIDCGNLCAAKVLANNLIEKLTINDSKNMVLIEELWERITSVPYGNCVYYYNKLELRQSNYTLMNHLITYPPECLALVQFLRYRPLSELNIPKEVIARHQIFVKLEKLPHHLYQECITKGYVSLKKLSPFDPQPNSRLKKIWMKVMKKRETTDNFTHPNTKNATLPITSKIIQNGDEDLIKDRPKDDQSLFDAQPNSRTEEYITEGYLIKDQLKEKQKKESVMEKERLLKTMLVKYDEKERKKEILYCQKMLTRYVMKHRRLLVKLEKSLINARKCVTSKLAGEHLLEKVRILVANFKVRKTVECLLKKLFDAMERVAAIEKSSKLPKNSKGPEEKFDKLFLKDVQPNSDFKAKEKAPVQKSRKQMLCDLDSKNMTCQEYDINESSLQCTSNYVTPEVGNKKVSVHNKKKGKLSSGNEFEQLLQDVQKNYTTINEVSMQENVKKMSSNIHLTLEKDNKIDEPTFQYVQKSSSFEVRSDFPVQKKVKRKLFLNSEKDSFEDVNKSLLQGIPKYFASVVEKKVQEQKNAKEKLISEKNNLKEVDEAILQEVPSYSSYTATVRKRRVKMSVLPTSEEDSSEDEFDQPHIPRFFIADLETDKIPVKKKKREIEFSEIESSEAEADEILFQLIQKYFTWKSDNEVPVHKSIKKISSTEPLILNKHSEKEIKEPSFQNRQEYSLPEIKKLVPVQKDKNKELCTLHLTSGKDCFKTKHECSTTKIKETKKSDISSSPYNPNSAALSLTSVCELNSKTADPFVNPILITEDKQFVECFCGKLNCVGLHLENFY